MHSFRQQLHLSRRLQHAEALGRCYGTRRRRRFPTPGKPMSDANDRTQTRSQTATQFGAAPAAAGPSSSAAAAAVDAEERVPLSIVVKDAVKRWFNEAHREAAKGDVKQQALLGQMLVEGYGCKANPELGREWAEKARRRGYKMAGVYCEL